MRHKYFGRKLNRDVKERKALFRSLVRALILQDKIKTTLPKAKAIQSLVEKLVNKAKDGSSQTFNQISAFLTKKEVIETLTDKIVPRFKDRVGGYVRIRRIGKRFGDGAQEVVMEWSKKDEEKEKDTKIKEKKDKDLGKPIPSKKINKKV